MTTIPLQPTSGHCHHLRLQTCGRRLRPVALCCWKVVLRWCHLLLRRHFRHRRQQQLRRSYHTNCNYHSYNSVLMTLRVLSWMLFDDFLSWIWSTFKRWRHHGFALPVLGLESSAAVIRQRSASQPTVDDQRRVLPVVSEEELLEMRRLQALETPWLDR